jgi:hypothetical protein
MPDPVSGTPLIIPIGRHHATVNQLELVPLKPLKTPPGRWAPSP